MVTFYWALKNKKWHLEVCWKKIWVGKSWTLFPDHTKSHITCISSRSSSPFMTQLHQLKQLVTPLKKKRKCWNLTCSGMSGSIMTSSCLLTFPPPWTTQLQSATLITAVPEEEQTDISSNVCVWVNMTITIKAQRPTSHFCSSNL